MQKHEVSNALRSSVVLLITLTGAAWLVHEGPVPVVRITTPIAEMAPFWYMLLAFPVLGLLAADLLNLITLGAPRVIQLELLCQLFLVMMLSNLRLGIRLPLSGHALVSSFFIFRRILLNDLTSRREHIEIVFAGTILALVSYIKLVWWTDPYTLTAGVICGFLMALVSKKIARKAIWRN